MCSLYLTHPSAHTPGAVGVRCLAQGSHLTRGQFLPEPRFKPTTSGYKSSALSIRATTEFIAAVSQQVNHHIEYLAVCHTLILVIKYISHYNHLVTNLTHL